MSRYTFGFSRDLDLPHEEAVTLLCEAARQEGFTIPGRVDVQGATEESGRCTVLELCDPLLLAKLVNLRTDLGLMGACRAVVRSRQKGSTICITDPYQAMAPLQEKVGKNGIVEELNRRLWNVYLQVVLAH
ncbi:MAG: DUF302 domain-containing protein [Caldilineae bacterium]|nr:MAG: DUF302 domain-containing protein [Caldilineae bacterium]